MKKEGAEVRLIAEEFGISTKRVYQILDSNRRRAASSYAEDGFVVLTHGWPDCLAYDPEKKEVKFIYAGVPKDDTLMNILKKAGFSVKEN